MIFTPPKKPTVLEKSFELLEEQKWYRSKSVIRLMPNACKDSLKSDERDIDIYVPTTTVKLGPQRTKEALKSTSS